MDMNLETKNISKPDHLPTKDNYKSICFEKYNLKELRYISKIYKLKTTQKKEILIKNIKDLFLKSEKIVKIQSAVRGHFVKKWCKSHGPALITRDCVNDTDFLTMENLKDIPLEQFFSYKDETHTYGFDILSIYTLVKNSKDALNPYNRKLFDESVVKQMKEMVSLSSILKKKVELQIVNEVNEKSFDFRSLDLFQTMNSLGNYSNHLWFTLLPKRRLLRFIKELNDVWFYRCQISRETQQKICPRGSPFRHVSLHRLIEEPEYSVKDRILKIMEEMVYSGIDPDSRCLGSYYVLGCLTLVSNEAANAMPWLFENFAY